MLGGRRVMTRGGALKIEVLIDPLAFMPPSTQGSCAGWYFVVKVFFLSWNHPARIG